MTTREKVEVVVNKQVEFNNNTNGVMWLNGITDKGNVIDWDTAIKLESAEAMESVPWKWWKDIENGQADLDNIMIEAVDILHFTVSDIVRSLYTGSMLEKETDMSATTPVDQEVLSDAITRTIDYMTNVLDKEDETLDAIISISVGELQNHAKDNKLDSKLLYLDVINAFKNIMTSSANDETNPYIALLEAVIAINGTLWFVNGDNYEPFNWDSMYKLYIGKNALNAVRQANGYKDGTYQKQWDGAEDNVYLTSIMSERDYTYDELYTALTDKYDSLTQD